jgi:hypothetical protein
MQLVTGAQTAIAINGEIGPFFRNKRGVRQGDPISPLLFNFMADALSAMIDAASRAGHIKGVVSHLIQGGVTHLQYADTHSFASPLMEFRRIVVVALLLLKTLALVSVVYMLLEHLLLQCNNAWRNSTTLSCYTILYLSTFRQANLAQPGKI